MEYRYGEIIIRVGGKRPHDEIDAAATQIAIE